MTAYIWRDLFEDVPEEAKYAGQWELSASGDRTRRRDEGFTRILRHVKRVPAILLDLELLFSITCIGLGEEMLRLLLLPIKCITCRRLVSLRDALSLCVMVSCLVTYSICGIMTTQLYSYLYHAVRRTSFIKLVMIFSMLDVLDKALSSVSQDTLEVLYAAWDAMRHPAPPSVGRPSVLGGDEKKAAVEGEEHGILPRQDFREALSITASATSDGTAATRKHNDPVRSVGLFLGSGIAAFCSVALHSLSLLLAAVTLNVAINADGSALVALLVSNNFNELKSTIFKKHTPESLFSVCAADAIERLQYAVVFLLICAQHISERFTNAAVVDCAVILFVEVAIDLSKLLFCCRFNGIPLSVFRSYTDLTLLDLAAEKVLWKLRSGGEVVVHVCPSKEAVNLNAAPAPHTHSAATALLLYPSFGFTPKVIRRTGFDSLAYTSLLMWSLLRLSAYLLTYAPLLLLVSFVFLCALKMLLTALVEGLSARFVLRTLLHHSHSVRTTLHEIRYPQPRHQRQTPVPARTFTLQLTPLLCALLKAERFDLQAGKKKG